MTDKLAYKFESTDLDDPVNSAFAVTPSDVTDFTEPTRAIYVGGNGNISAEMFGTGTAVIFSNVVAGTVLPLRLTRINSTGTTATSLVGLY